MLSFCSPIALLLLALRLSAGGIDHSTRFINHAGFTTFPSVAFNSFFPALNDLKLALLVVVGQVPSARYWSAARSRPSWDRPERE